MAADALQRRQHLGDGAAPSFERGAQLPFALVERLEPVFGLSDRGFHVAHAGGRVDQLLIELAPVVPDRFDLALEAGLVLDRLFLLGADGCEFLLALLERVRIDWCGGVAPGAGLAVGLRSSGALVAAGPLPGGPAGRTGMPGGFVEAPGGNRNGTSAGGRGGVCAEAAIKPSGKKPSAATIAGRGTTVRGRSTGFITPLYAKSSPMRKN